MKIKVNNLENESVEVGGFRREGSCNNCGKCCESPFINCNGRKDGKCSIYDKRPYFCWLFPYDPKVTLPKECSYKWVKIERNK